MKRIILAAALLGTLASAIAPAFADETTTCSSSRDWARCVIEQSQQDSTQ